MYSTTNCYVTPEQYLNRLHLDCVNYFGTTPGLINSTTVIYVALILAGLAVLGVLTFSWPDSEHQPAAPIKDCVQQQPETCATTLVPLSREQDSFADRSVDPTRIIRRRRLAS